jgi:centrosomal CEP192-like protein/ASPM-SPD-2-Hydin domain-containing protein
MAWKLDLTAELPSRTTEPNDRRRQPGGVGITFILLAAAAVLLNGRKGPSIDSLPASMDFGSQPVQAVAPDQLVKIRNVGTADLHLSNAVIAGAEASDFQIVKTTCMRDSVPPGHVCEVSLRFHPAGAGHREAKLILADDAGDSPQSIDLVGTGIARGDLAVTPATMSFPEQLKGGMSDWMPVSLQNVGGSPLQVSAVELADDNSTFALDAATCLNTTLASGQSCDIKVRFTPADAKNYLAHLLVRDSTGDAPHDVFLSGNARETSVASARVTPSPVDFGMQPLNQAAAQSLTLVSTGNIPVRTGDIQITGEGAGEFLADKRCAHSELAPGNQCVIQIRFTPRTQGKQQAQLSLRNEAGDSLQTITLVGYGENPPTPSHNPDITRVVAQPRQYTFPQQEVLTSSGPAKITITSVGNTPARVQKFYTQGSSSNEFAVNDVNCAARTLTLNQECSLNVTFAPKAAGSASDHIAELVVEVANANPTRIALHGSVSAPPASAARPGFSVEPDNIAFGNTQMGQQSEPQAITLSNPGSAPISVKAVLPNESAGEFRVVEANCHSSLIPAHGNCIIAMAFTPQHEGAVQSKLTLASAAPVQVETVRLTGRAMPGPPPPSSFFVKPPDIAFPASPLGTPSDARRVSLVNPGGAPISIRAVLQGANQGDFRVVTANCHNQEIPAGGNCEITLAFTPLDTGSRRSMLTIASSTQTQSVSLSGTGLPKTVPEKLLIKPTQLSFGQVQVGMQSNRQLVALYNPGSTTVAFQSFVNGDDFQAVATNCPNSTAPPGASCVIALVFAPHQEGSRNAELALTWSSQQQSVHLNGYGLRKSAPPPPQTGWCCIHTNSPATLSHSPGYSLVQSSPNDCSQHNGQFFTDYRKARSACRAPVVGLNRDQEMNELLAESLFR